eukprot:1180561-Alexandrium_andersonii.AAC.1
MPELSILDQCGILVRMLGWEGGMIPLRGHFGNRQGGPVSFPARPHRGSSGDAPFRPGPPRPGFLGAPPRWIAEGLVVNVMTASWSTSW